MNEEKMELEIDNMENQSEEEITESKSEKSDDKKKSFLKELLHLVLYILGVLVVTYLIVHYVGQRTIVVGESMMETLQDGDNLVVDKISYRIHNPERFDIIVFPYEYEEDTYYIKRIIGLPGETIQIDEDGNIWINGTILDEDYGRDVMQYPGMAEEPITLGEGEYFVLGDNRNESKDSRFEDVGIIKKEDIVGKAIFRMYPFSSFGVIKNGND